MGTRATILDAAFHLIAARGYFGISTRDIAERAGIHETTLFRHFKSKKDIAIATMQAMVDEARSEHIAQAVERAPDIEAGARIAGHFYSHVWNKEFLRFQLVIAIELPEALRCIVTPIRVSIVKRLEAAAREDAIRDVDPIHAEHMLLLSIYGHALGRAIGFTPLRERQHADIDAFIDIWLRGICAPCKRPLALVEKYQ